MDEKKVNDVVNAMETMKFFSQLNRFPNEFYKLNDKEKAEAVKRYRRRNGLDGKKKEGLE
jgi:hypothetical protein